METQSTNTDTRAKGPVAIAETSNSPELDLSGLFSEWLKTFKDGIECRNDESWHEQTQREQRERIERGSNGGRNKAVEEERQKRIERGSNGSWHREVEDAAWKRRNGIFD